MEKQERDLIHEIELKIIVCGKRAGTVSCTPQDMEELVAGWLFAEGMIREPNQIREMVFYEDDTRVDVLLADDAGPFRSGEDRSEGGSTKGTCSYVFSEKNEIVWSRENLADIYELFSATPPLFARTHAAHSCMIVRHTEAGGIEVLYRSEDAGRHSAMDKAIGWALLHDVDLSDCMLFTSGRTSTRMAMKAAKAGVSALAGKGTVTAEAVDIAREHGMALIGYVREDSAVWFAGGAS